MVKRQAIFYASKIILTCCIFFIIFKIIDFQAVINILQKIDIIYILPLIILNLIFWLLMSLSIWILILPLRKISFIELLKFNIVSLAIGNITPAHIGEGVIIFYLKKFNLNTKKGLAIFLLNKTISFVIIAFCGIVGMTYYKLANYKLIFIFIMICLFSILIIGIQIRVVTKNIIIKKYLSGLHDFLETIADLIKKHFLFVVLNLLVNIIKLLVGVLIIFISFKAVNLNVNYITILFIFNLGRLPAFLPVSLAGLGVLESGTTYLFHNLGFDSSLVLSGLILHRAIGISITIIVLVMTGVTSLKQVLLSGSEGGAPDA